MGRNETERSVFWGSLVTVLKSFSSYPGGWNISPKELLELLREATEKEESPTLKERKKKTIAEFEKELLNAPERPYLAPREIPSWVPRVFFWLGNAGSGVLAIFLLFSLFQHTFLRRPWNEDKVLANIIMGHRGTFAKEKNIPKFLQEDKLVFAPLGSVDEEDFDKYEIHAKFEAGVLMASEDYDKKVRYESQLESFQDIEVRQFNKVIVDKAYNTIQKLGYGVLGDDPVLYLISEDPRLGLIKHDLYVLSLGDRNREAPLGDENSEATEKTQSKPTIRKSVRISMIFERSSNRENMIWRHFRSVKNLRSGTLTGIKWTGKAPEGFVQNHKDLPIKR